ncbi:BA14K family protein [Shinella sp. PSBB067]|uniref:BA14K family protein n=1 Tax=unclassified Shinella TaxID=2643062 RepID=UPI00193B37E3|nr:MULTISPECIES: BA14K family protein [unclassified Shinella]MBN9052971.1 BA14K family protein [Hyphomicrobiales bacterium]QRI65676.1 BA14K family protein [Shinella sp. PSBB067]
MNKVIKALVLSAAVAATTLTATAGIAQARDRDGYWGPRPYPRHHHRNNDALVGGAIGLATGMIIGGAIASQPRYEERRVYVEPDYYPEPERRVIYRPAPSYEPWTQSWYRYCSQRYRSFDPNSGTFVGYDGREHFCTAG